MKPIKKITPLVKGLKGDKGETGLRGARGIQGEQGPRGAQGITGDQGIRGEQGDSIVGPRGPEGVQGEVGKRGERGLRGYKGIQGRPGKDAQAISVRELSTQDQNFLKDLIGKKAVADIQIKDSASTTEFLITYTDGKTKRQVVEKGGESGTFFQREKGTPAGGGGGLTPEQETLFSVNLPGGAGMLADTAVTTATATSVNISAGDGFISTNNADGSVSTQVVTWEASTETIPAAILAVDQAFYITKDSSGTTQFYAFPIDETVISAEIAIVSAGVISGSILTIGSGNFGAKNQMTEQTLAELFLNIGPALEGVEITPDPADLTFDVTAGAEFFGGNNWRTDRQNPNHFQFAGLTNPTFIYAYQDPAETNGWTSFATTTIDPEQWDDGSGTLATVPNGSKVTIQPLWISVTTGTVIAQLGQQTYKDVATALAALPTAAEMATPAVANLPRLGWLVITKGQTILADATYIKQLNKGTNISPSAAVKMQDAYDNTDAEPEVLTNSTNGAVSFQRGSTADTDNVFEVQNGAGSTTFSVDGNGNVTANNLQNLTDTDELSEGATNLYYTEARVSANTNVAANTAKVGVTNEPSSDPSGVTGADAIINIMSLTQAEYDAIGTPNASTFYIITDAV